MTPAEVLDAVFAGPRKALPTAPHYAVCHAGETTHTCYLPDCPVHGGPDDHAR